MLIVKQTSLLKNGESIPFLFTGVRLNVRGKQYLTGIGLDITDRIQAEADRERMQVQLLQSQKMEAVGHLAGGIAHDFNNMLSVVSGTAELALMKTDESNPLHKSFKTIHETSQKSAELVRQLLAFSRKQTISPKVLDINKTISGMLKMLRRLIGEDIDLVWDPGQNIHLIKIDPSQIDQILANLVVNARDAITKNGKITIETQNVTIDEAFCSDKPQLKCGRFVMLAVSDNGSGIEPELQKKIFEPFFTTKAVGKGTGLGLATVYGIVKQNRGNIHVYSEVNEGTTFKIYFPIAIEQVVDQIPIDTQIQLGKASGKILIVEDDLSIIKVSSTILEQLGYTVIATSSPAAAIDFIRSNQNQFDLLLTDVVMPEMNGKELVEKILEIKPDQKYMYMSGYTADVIAHHGILEAGVAFIQKPFSINDLAQKIAQTIATKP